ncbi:MAG: DinB family protein [Ferruginibacter sp.]|nr:DinB family protein [Ferruginibacter sp.]
MTDSPTNVQGYFKRYTDLVNETTLASAFTAQSTVIKELLPKITEEKSTFAYAEGKWTIKEVLQHLIDAERVFAFRALCFSRKEAATLPSFDENDYAVNSNANNRSWQNLVDEFLAVRRSTILLFESFDQQMLHCMGTAGSNILSAEQLGYITVGHFTHHSNVLAERYFTV